MVAYLMSSSHDEDLRCLTQNMTSKEYFPATRPAFEYSVQDATAVVKLLYHTYYSTQYNSVSLEDLNRSEIYTRTKK